MIWAVRGVLLALGIAAVFAVLTLTRTSAPPLIEAAAPAAAPTPTPPPAPQAPTLTIAPRTDTIVSRVLRVVPTPESHAVPDVQMGGHWIEVRDYDYSPTEIHIRVGDWITWANGGQEEHSLNGLFDTDRWTSGPIFPTQSYTRVFGFAGRYEYICSYFPTMRGVVIVET